MLKRNILLVGISCALIVGTTLPLFSYQQVNDSKTIAKGVVDENNVDNYIQNYLEMMDDIECRSQIDDNFKVIGFREHTIDTVNYSQSSLNEAYNKKHNLYGLGRVKADGTCSTVAATILAEYYTRKECEKRGITNKFDKIETFCNTLDYGVNNLVYSSLDSGAWIARTHDLDWFALKYNSVDRKVFTYSYQIYEKLKEYLNYGPMGLDLPGHTVVCCGYNEYDIYYTETITKTFLFWSWEEVVEHYETISYIKINNGWYDSETYDNAYSYFPTIVFTDYNLLKAIFAPEYILDRIY